MALVDIDAILRGSSRPGLDRCRRLGVLALRVADLTPRVAAVPAKRELSLGQVVHAQMEKLIDGSSAASDDSVDAQVHVAVRRVLIVADGQTVERGKELGEILRGGCPDVGFHEFTAVGRERRDAGFLGLHR